VRTNNGPQRRFLVCNVDEHTLRDQVLVDPLRSALPAKARPLHATERTLTRTQHAEIDTHHTVIERSVNDIRIVDMVTLTQPQAPPLRASSEPCSARTSQQVSLNFLMS